MQLAFDWTALYGHGFSFAVSDTVLLRGRTWPEITRKTLDKFSLVAVADSPNRMVLTTLPDNAACGERLSLVRKG